MPVYLKKLPTATLDVKTGQLVGIPEQEPAPQDIGIDPEELVKQVMELAKKGVPLQKILETIEKHPDIKNVQTAKEIAKARYPGASLKSVMESKPNHS